MLTSVEVRLFLEIYIPLVVETSYTNITGPLLAIYSDKIKIIH